MSIIGCDLPDDGVPLSALRRAPAPRVRVVSLAIDAASRIVRRRITRNAAVSLRARGLRVPQVAMALECSPEHVYELLTEAGAHVPRRRCSAAPRGRR